jgi:hypothetical protein
VQSVDVDGQPNLVEKKMLLAALRFYFGPGQWWNTVRDVTDVNALDRLNTTLRQPGERYETLEQQTGLGANYFANDHPNTDQVKLYAAATRNNPGRVPSYFLYEARNNLTFYVGPDWYHDPGGKLVVINTLVLDAQHRLVIHNGPSPTCASIPNPPQHDCFWPGSERREFSVAYLTPNGVRSLVWFRLPAR